MDNSNNDRFTIIETDPTGRYERTAELLGRGAYKEVYRAYDCELGVEVAWNQLAVGNLTEKTAQKILDEIRILQGLNSDNIIRFYHSWVAPSVSQNDSSFQVYFITELMTSGTLKSYIKKTKGSIKTKVIRNWAKQILRGLNYLHTLSPPIIHRDLKCDNIFINGNNGQAKIGDFGLAIIKRRERECISTVIGTPEFMAPELYDEHYDEKIDIYSFGMCIFELITRDYPYSECENAAQIYRKVTKGIKPAALANIADTEVREFIELCIQSDYKLRPSAAELLVHPFISFEVSIKEMEESSSGNTNSISSSPLFTEAPALDINDALDSAKASLSCNIQVVSFENNILELDMVVAYGLLASSGTTKSRQIKFPINIQTESPQLIATEMVKHELVPNEALPTIINELSKTIAEFLHSTTATSSSFTPNIEESGYEPDLEHSPSKGSVLSEIDDIAAVSSKSSNYTKSKSSDNILEKSFNSLLIEPNGLFLAPSNCITVKANGNGNLPEKLKILLSSSNGCTTPLSEVQAEQSCYRKNPLLIDDLLEVRVDNSKAHSSSLSSPKKRTSNSTIEVTSSKFFEDLSREVSNSSDLPSFTNHEKNIHTLSYLDAPFCTSFSTTYALSSSKSLQEKIPKTSTQIFDNCNGKESMASISKISEITPSTSIDPIQFLQQKELEEFVISASSSSNINSSTVSSCISSPNPNTVSFIKSEPIDSDTITYSNTSIKSLSNPDIQNGQCSTSTINQYADISSTSLETACKSIQDLPSKNLLVSISSLERNQSSSSESLIDFSCDNTARPSSFVQPLPSKYCYTHCNNSLDLLDVDEIPDDASVSQTASKLMLNESFSLLDIK